MIWAEFDAEAWIEARILSALPKGTSFREVRPDMVSLADVAGKLKVKRQALQKRDMPPPYFPGYYRMTEVAATIQAQMAKSPRKSRFEIDAARPWFAAGHPCQRPAVRHRSDHLSSGVVGSIFCFVP